MKQLDGPRLEPRGIAPTSLVVLLHGYGANGDDLIALGDDWRRWLPEAVFVAPNAPEAIPGMHGGLQWFALTMRDPSEYWPRRGVGAAGRSTAFSTMSSRAIGFPPDRLVLVGFSQGTMMALHVGLSARPAPAGVVGYSGLLAGPEHLAEITARPPILLIHGEADDLIPVAALHIAREQLAGNAICWWNGTYGPGWVTASTPRANAGRTLHRVGS